MADINVTPELRDAKMPPNLSREERLAFMANRAETIQKLNPGHDMKLDTNWWAPSVNLGYDMDESLDAETKRKVNEATMKMFQPGAGLDAVNTVREELKGLLVGHEDIYKSLESTLFANEKGLQQAQEIIQQKVAAGEFSFLAGAEQKSSSSQ
ncbi:unnamed protein product [Clonostachys rosea]|uniref:Uncharacterized protein n=1 Tax=Bionectria ochroleuca TaxID=29856 RepID=A0ABY6U233_BIOOC|nr:unnamed protein product [Clonostachys rosea]